jgi:ABC-type nickel/cobalt efflux system permease component RcnA
MSPPDTATLAPLAGLAAGAIHVLSGPDHLAAVLPFASGARRRAAAMGLAWGVGHSAGVLLLGAAALLLEGAVDLEGASAFAERTVGFLLIALGVWTLRRARWVVVHTHAHGHEEGAHAHAHVHIGDPTVGAEDHPERGAHARHRHSALGFGVVHGVAGTSHLVAVVPAVLLGSVSGVGYLAGYLVGSAAAMAGFAAVAGRLLGGSARRARLGLQLSGAFAVLVGGLWVVQTLA